MAFNLEGELVHGVDVPQVGDDEVEQRRSLGCGAVELAGLVDLRLVLLGFVHLRAADTPSESISRSLTRR